MTKLVIFGTGKVSMGFIPEVFYERNLSITFINKNIDSINKFRKCKSYTIKKSDGSTLEITNINFLHYEQDKKEIIDAINNCDIVATAVGYSNLEDIAIFINSISDNFSDKNIPLICFENGYKPATYISSFLKHKNFNFINAVVDRIIPNNINENNIIECEEFCSVIIDNDFTDKFLFRNCKLTENYDVEFTLKFLVVNGLHFIIATLGIRNECNTISQSLMNKNINKSVKKIIKIFRKYLPNKLNISKKFINSYIKNTINRFYDNKIIDSNSRISRNMIIKLSNNERVVSIYKLIKTNREKKFFDNLFFQLYTCNNFLDDDWKLINKKIDHIGLSETVLEFSGIKINFIDKK